MQAVLSPITLSAIILSSSFFGSWHCAGMCGPVASFISEKGSLKLYQLGRLLSYTVLGSIMGAIGQLILNNNLQWLRLSSLALMAAILLSMGLKSFFAKSTTHSPMQKILFRYLSQFQNLYKTKSSFVMGLLTSLLPCGWLYTYLVSAAASQSPWAGAWIMTLFWLGSLPALQALPWLLKRGMKDRTSANQRWTGVILLAAGMYSLISFLYQLR